MSSKAWDKYFAANSDVAASWTPARLNAPARPTKSWSVPADAGGADPFDRAVDAFCEVVGIDPTALTVKERRQWARQLETVAGESGPEMVVEAIRAKPESTIDWKAWTTPYAVREDLRFLLLQVRSGGVKGKNDKMDALDRRRAARGRL